MRPGLKRFLRELHLFRDKKIGIALGSGAARGLAHLGVLKVLEEEGVKIDCVSGASAGSIIGAFLAAGKIKELNRFCSKLTSWDSLKLIDPILIPKMGLVEGKKVEKFLRDYLGDLKIEDLEIPFACVATDFYTGSEVILKSGDLVTAVRASISIPGIFKPVKMNGMMLVDGGVVNPVPVEVVRNLGAEVVIAVDVTPNVSQNVISSGNGAVMKGDYSHSKKNFYDPPNVFEIIIGSIGIMETQINKMRMKSEKPDVIITPELNGLGLFDFHKYSLGLKEGERATWEVIRRIEKFVK